MTDRSQAGPCLGPEEIESLTGAEAPSGAARDHIAVCERCRAAVEESRANNTFLSGLGADLAGAAGHTSLFEDPPPETVPGYDIEGEIHRGAQGVVYKAVQLRTQRTVALKMLLEGSYSTPKQRMRLQREAEIAASLRHPNIVTVYDGFMLPGGRFVIAMEHIDGVPLDEPPANAAPLRERLAMLAMVCDAVGYAHLRGVIHRDLKPGNILVDSSGEPHVVDFGIAKQMGTDGPMPTMTGEFAGTLAYASPEQVRGKPDEIDLRTDIYSMGVIIYEAVTGRHPYPIDGSMYEAIREILHTPPTPPRTFDTTIEPDLETILLRALEKDAPRRYPSVVALGADLRHYLAGEPIQARRDSTMYVLRRLAQRHKVGVAVGLGFALVVVAFAVGMAILYGVASNRREQLDLTNIRQSIEHAKLLAATGNGAAAEDLAWREQLRAVDEQGELALSPQSPTLWALSEVYARQPCVATWATGEGEIFDAALAAGGEVVALTERGIVRMKRGDGATERFPIAGGCILGMLRDDATSALAATATSAALIDTRTGKAIRRFEHGLGPQDEIATAAFTRSGDLCALALRNKSVLVIDTATGLVRYQFSGFAAPIESVAFSPDGQLLAGVDHGNYELLWAMKDGAQLQSVQSSFLGAHASVAEQLRARVIPLPSARGRLVVAIGVTVMMQNFAAREGDNADAASASLDTFQAPGGAVRTLVPSPDSTMIAAGLDGSAKIVLWNTGTRTVRRVLAGHRSPVTSVRMSEDNQSLISGDAGGVVKLWDLSRESWAMLAAPLAKPITSAAFMGGEAVFGGDGGVVAAIASSGTKSPGMLREIHGKVIMSPEAFDLAPSAGFLVGAGPAGACAHIGADSKVLLWKSSISGPPIESEIRWHDGKPASNSLVAAAMDSSGSRIAVANDLGQLWVVTLPGAIARRVPLNQGRVIGVAGIENGDFVAMMPHALVRVGATGTVWVPVSRPGPSLTAIATSAGLLAVGDQRGGVTILDAGTMKVRAELRKPGPAVVSIAFGPGGLLAAGGGHMIRLWDIGTRTELATIEEPHLLVNAIALSTDGSRLAVAGSNYSASYAGVWDFSMFQPSVAGNVEYQLQLRDATPAAKERMRAWAAKRLQADGAGMDQGKQ